MKDIRQTARYARHMRLQRWKVEKIRGVYCYIKKIPILGHFCKIQRPEKVLGEDNIKKLRNKYRIFQVVIEPVNQKRASNLKSRGYRLSKSPYLPSKTLYLNLTKSKNFLFKQLKKDARYSLKKTENLPLFTNPNLKSFHSSWVKSVNWKRWVPKLSNLLTLEKVFNQDFFVLASHNGNKNKKSKFPFNSGAIFLKTKDVCYYWQAFTSPTGRETLAQYRILWEGILWGKKSGCQVFDFEGIFDPRFPNRSWHGFTTFKKKFSSQEITYPGAFVKSHLISPKRHF